LKKNLQIVIVVHILRKCLFIWLVASRALTSCGLNLWVENRQTSYYCFEEQSNQVQFVYAMLFSS